jgi:hypothetical protein
VEEEIPPSWQLTDAGKDSTTADDTCMDKGEESSYSSYHLAEEHLELLFDIRNGRTNRCMAKGSSINDWTCCLRHSQKPQRKPAAQLARRDSPRHTPLMDIQVLQWLDAAHPRSHFFVNYRFRMDSDKIVFTLFSGCVILLVMAALNEASPRLVRWNRVPVETISPLHNFCKKKNSAMIDTSTLGATYSGFPHVAEQVAAKHRTSCILMI